MLSVSLCLPPVFGIWLSLFCADVLVWTSWRDCWKRNVERKICGVSCLPGLGQYKAKPLLKTRERLCCKKNLCCSKPVDSQFKEHCWVSMIRCYTTLLANRMFYTSKLPNCVSYPHNLSQLPTLYFLLPLSHSLTLSLQLVCCQHHHCC